MEKEVSRLFVANPNKPMKFCIYKGKMLLMKCNETSKKIKQHGGIVVSYDDKDSECIILSDKSYIPNDDNVFDIKYIKKCIAKNKIQNLIDYRISKPSDEQREIKKCVSWDKIVNDEKCIHVHNNGLTATEILEKIEKIVN